jgi:hypothetical protein
MNIFYSSKRLDEKVEGPEMDTSTHKSKHNFLFRKANAVRKQRAFKDRSDRQTPVNTVAKKHGESIEEPLVTQNLFDEGTLRPGFGREKRFTRYKKVKQATIDVNRSSEKVVDPMKDEGVIRQDFSAEKVFSKHADSTVDNPAVNTDKQKTVDVAETREEASAPISPDRNKVVGVKEERSESHNEEEQSAGISLLTAPATGYFCGCV